MALRKFKKLMVPVSIIIMILFLLSAIVGSSYLFKGASDSQQGEVAIEVNGDKIYTNQIEDRVSRMIEQFNANKDKNNKEANKEDTKTDPEDDAILENLVRRYIVDQFITSKLILKEGKDTKVKISKEEVDSQLETFKEQFGDDESFLKYIQSLGYNTEGQIRKEFEKQVLQLDTIKAIEDSFEVSDEEIEKNYNRFKYTDYEGKTLDEAKEDIITSIRTANKSLALQSKLSELRKKAKIKFNNKEYETLYKENEEVAYESENFKLFNRDVDERLIGNMTYMGISPEDAKSQISEIFEKELSRGERALKSGVTIEDKYKNLGMPTLRYAQDQYFNSLIDNYKASDEELRSYYNAHEKEYDLKHSIDGYVVGDYYKMDQDFTKAEKKANELKKTVNAGNFAKLAKENSADGSAAQGGDLGKADIKTYVKEFADAIRNAKTGDIVGPVKTEFGYHIIYLRDKDKDNPEMVTASHILIKPTETVNEDSKKEVTKKLNGLKKDLETKKVTWKEIVDNERYKYEIKELFTKVAKEESIPGIGFDKSVNEKLFNAKKDEILDYSNATAGFITVKTNEREAKKANFEDVRDKVRAQLAYEKALEQINENN